MATEADLIYRHRLSQIALARTVTADTVRVLAQLDLRALDDSFRAYATVMLALVQQRREQSQVLADVYYQGARIAAGVDEPFASAQPRPTPSERIMTSLLVTGPVLAKTLTARGVDLPTIRASIGSATARAMQRHVLNAGRDQVFANIAADPQSGGWMRITDGQPCGFCAMLASRGPVYKTQASAGFGRRFHDGCGCTIVSVFRASGPQIDDWKQHQDNWLRAKDIGRESGGLSPQHIFERLTKGETPVQALDSVRRYNTSGWGERARQKYREQADAVRESARLRKQQYSDRLKSDPAFADTERRRFLDNLGDKAKPKR